MIGNPDQTSHLPILLSQGGWNIDFVFAEWFLFAAILEKEVETSDKSDFKYFEV